MWSFQGLDDISIQIWWCLLSHFCLSNPLDSEHSDVSPSHLGAAQQWPRFRPPSSNKDNDCFKINLEFRRGTVTQVDFPEECICVDETFHLKFILILSSPDNVIIVKVLPLTFRSFLIICFCHEILTSANKTAVFILVPCNNNSGHHHCKHLMQLLNLIYFIDMDLHFNVYSNCTEYVNIMLFRVWDWREKIRCSWREKISVLTIKCSWITSGFWVMEHILNTNY